MERLTPAVSTTSTSDTGSDLSELDLYTPRQSPAQGGIPSMYKNAISGSTVLITGISESPNLSTTTNNSTTVAQILASASPSHLILSSRNPSRLSSTAAHISALYPNVAIKLLPMDLRSLASVRKAAFELENWCRSSGNGEGRGVKKIDVLVNDAAVVCGSGSGSDTSSSSSSSSDDDDEDADDEAYEYESSFEVCHLGHFLLTNLLLRAGLLSDCGEVDGENENEKSVTTTSTRKEGSASVYKKRRGYDQVETANMLFSVALANAWNLQMRNVLFRSSSSSSSSAPSSGERVGERSLL